MVYEYLCEHSDLNSDSQHPHKKQSVAIYVPVTLALRGVGCGDWRLLGLLAAGFR